MWESVAEALVVTCAIAGEISLLNIKRIVWLTSNQTVINNNWWMSIPRLTRENIVVIFAIPQNWPVKLGLLSEHGQLFLRPDALQLYSCRPGSSILSIGKSENPPLSFVSTQVLKCCCFAEGFGFYLHYETNDASKGTSTSYWKTDKILHFVWLHVRKKEMKKKTLLA